jgi:hypothetical protein
MKLPRTVAQLKKPPGSGYPELELVINRSNCVSAMKTAAPSAAVRQRASRAYFVVFAVGVTVWLSCFSRAIFLLC